MAIFELHFLDMKFSKFRQCGSILRLGAGFLIKDSFLLHDSLEFRLVDGTNWRLL